MIGKLVRKKQRDFEDGTRYEGGWERGLFHGHGTLTWGKFAVNTQCWQRYHTGTA